MWAAGKVCIVWRRSKSFATAGIRTNNPHNVSQSHYWH